MPFFVVVDSNSLCVYISTLIFKKLDGLIKTFTMSLWLSRDSSRNEIYDLRFLHLLVSRDIRLCVGLWIQPIF